MEALQIRLVEVPGRYLALCVGLNKSRSVADLAGLSYPDHEIFQIARVGQLVPGITID
jgi:hypothetical protein